MKIRKLIAAVALATAAAAPVAAKPILSILPATQQVAVGGSVSVDVVISGFQAIGEVVSAYDINVGYDTSLLSWSVITQFLQPFGSASNVLSGIDGTSGSIGGDLTSFLSDTDLAALQGDPITLLSFTFQALTDGVALLDFGPDPDFNRLVTGRLDPSGIAGVLDLDYVGACIGIGAGVCRQVQVPEPGSLALVGLALAGALIPAALRRRRIGARAQA
jgi:hypothetical protein